MSPETNSVPAHETVVVCLKTERLAAIRDVDRNGTDDIRGRQRFATAIAQVDPDTSVGQRHQLDVHVARHPDHTAMT